MKVIKYYKNIVMTDEFRLLDSELFDTLICNKIISLNDEVIYGKIPYRTSAKIVTTNFYEKANEDIDILAISIDFTCYPNTVKHLKYMTTAGTVTLCPSINLGFADTAYVSAFLITDINILEDTVKQNFSNNQVTFNTNTVRIKGYIAVKNPFKEPE